MTRAQVINDINKIEDNGNNTALEVRTVLTDLLDFSDEGITSNTQSITTLNLNVSNLTTRVVTLETKVTNNTTDIETINEEIATINDDITFIKEELELLGRPFHFWKDSPVTNNLEDLLWYSFKGNVRNRVNFTFKLLIKRNETALGMDHYFALDAELVKTIKEILFRFPDAADRLSFVVASNNPLRIEADKPYSKIFTATIELVEITSPKSAGIKFNFHNPGGLEKDLLRIGDQIFTSIQFHCPAFNFNLDK
jgi:uncharacterized coiled-coil protein SlyX